MKYLYFKLNRDLINIINNYLNCIVKNKLLFNSVINRIGKNENNNDHMCMFCYESCIINSNYSDEFMALQGLFGKNITNSGNYDEGGYYNENGYYDESELLYCCDKCYDKLNIKNRYKIWIKWKQDFFYKDYDFRI